VVAGTLKAAF